MRTAPRDGTNCLHVSVYQSALLQLEPSILAFSQSTDALLHHEIFSEKLCLRKRKFVEDVIVNLRLTAVSELTRLPPELFVEALGDLIARARRELFQPYLCELSASGVT